MHITIGQRNNLEQWLREWKIHCQLERLDEDVCGLRESRVAGVRNNARVCGSVLRLGDVRLLYPDRSPSWCRPVYLAVISAVDEDTVWAAPFSRFAYPALPGEWLTGRDESQMRVLCLWNMFQFGRERFDCGWEVDRLSDLELEQASTLLAALHSGAELPKNMADRVGPDIFSPSDPRWDYQQEEIELVESLQPMLERSDAGSPYTSKETPVEYRSRAADRDDSEYQ